MDHDHNEFQGQNRQLAGEGCSKVSLVPHPYALPKFEFDDTLHGDLNYNNLVESKVFLGEEDNQWIEEYSRGSSGIEFNSSGVELRRNNVWSEATTSESVEMLLKSFGQEEKVMDKADTEKSDADICDETVSLTKALDPNLNQETQISGGELDSVIINEKHNSSVLEEKVDNTSDDVFLKDPNKDHPESSENLCVSVDKFHAIGLSKIVSSGAAEESIQIKENSTEVPFVSDTMIVKSYNENPLTNVECTDNLSAETSNPVHEDPLAETSTPFSENLSAETNNPFSENPSDETCNPFTDNPFAENSIPFSDNPSTETSILYNENPLTDASILFSENPPSGTSIPFSEISATENSILISENPSSKTSIPFSETPPAEYSTPFSKDPDSPKSNAGSLYNTSPLKISSIKKNETIIETDARQIISNSSVMSACNLPQTGCESSGSVQVDCNITSSELAIYLDQHDSFNEKEDANLTLEGNDIDIEVVQAVDSQKNVKPSLLLEGSKENIMTAYNFESDVSVRVEQVSDQRSSPDIATAENDEQPKSPIFGVSLVHQSSKENNEIRCPSAGNSQNEFSQVESVVASVSKNPSALVEKEASHDHSVKPVLQIDDHCVTPVEGCNASQIEQLTGTKNDSQDCFKKLNTDIFESLEKTCNNSQTGCLSCLQDRKESMIEGKHKRAEIGQDEKGSLSSPTFEVSNLPKITDGPSKDSTSNEIDLKKFPEASVSPQNHSGLTSQIGVKKISERKPRRKSVGKENTRKDTARGKITPVLLTAHSTAQVTRFEEVKSYENVTKPGVVLSSPKIPDLNNSTSIFQQPFTDIQQVQLRAQILVYGSLISGSPTEETYMIAAFGQSDGGRTWEGVWRACLERLHGPTSQPKCSTPIQSGSGSRSDQVIKHASIQNKIPSSPIGGPTNKGTPSFVSPMIPFSSPLWNTPTPSDNLQSGGMAKTTHFNYHQTLSPIRPTYQASPPPILNYNSSRLSQGPFSGQWLASSSISTFNPTHCFPLLPITESVKLIPVKDSGGLVVKHISNPTVLNSAPIIFPKASSVSDMKRSAISSDQPSTDSNSITKKKDIPVVSIPCSTSTEVSMPAFVTSKISPAMFLSAVASPTHHTKGGNQNMDKVVISEEILTKVEESKLQAKEATEHADSAMLHCNVVWSQVQRRYNYNLNSNDEAKLVSSAVSIAAAASVAKVAATAAKIASDVAEQARSMVNILNRNQNLDQSEAASISVKDAENLDAIVKAAELAAEAVSQAGKIVAMSEPFSLRDLIEAGPVGYWKTPRMASKQKALVAENLNIIDAKTASDKGIMDTNSGADLMENRTMEVDGTSVSFTSQEKDKRKPWARKGPEVFKTVRAAPESEIGSIDTSIVGQSEPKIPAGNLRESDIEEGCLVEVYKDDDKHNGAWFGGTVLSLKDGKALVSYMELESDEGSGKFKEWLPLEVEASEIPKIRLAHPVTTMQGTRKRSRTAATDFMWSSGDRVDVWIQNHWRGGVVMETNKTDATSLTVRFPAEGKTSVVRSWFVRPTLIRKDAKWIMCHTSEKCLSSPGNMPQEKRLKLGSPIVERKRKAGPSENIDIVDPRKQEESRPLSLSTHESVFNVGCTRDSKVNSHRIMRSGLRKEGSGVIFGVPKPGKKQKFMDVSKHYVAGGYNNTTHDTIKFTRYLIPHPPGSRGWKNNSKSDLKVKQAAETKPQMSKSRKPPIPSVRTTSTKSTVNEGTLDSVSDGENQPGQQIQMEHESSTIENKSECFNKRKFASITGGKETKVESPLQKLLEPRRSNRKIQPTSRLLEGLQSSMTMSKMPTHSHSTTQRSHNKVAPKGK
ncbi:hypothetical protein SSX86_001639 [Deinandra increscens subsp. villosa]|uniref:Agenet domain-containing protein n=1 Tax=Deinandra increscens subsp. villosa TaxID=3103831 RepID=A0AAP0HB01_9ASTR